MQTQSKYKFVRDTIVPAPTSTTSTTLGAANYTDSNINADIQMMLTDTDNADD
jgi:hypothetical protein